MTVKTLRSEQFWHFFAMKPLKRPQSPPCRKQSLSKRLIEPFNNKVLLSQTKHVMNERSFRRSVFLNTYIKLLNNNARTTFSR